MKSIIAAFVLLAIIVFTGCASEQPADAGAPFFQEMRQKLSDGRTVLCLYKETSIGGYANGSSPAMSCDWDRARGPVPAK